MSKARTSARPVRKAPVKVWHEPEPRPCSRCRLPISTGEQFMDRVEGWRRICSPCIAGLRAEREAIADRKDIAALQAAREHRDAVRHAELTGLVL